LAAPWLQHRVGPGSSQWQRASDLPALPVGEAPSPQEAARSVRQQRHRAAQDRQSARGLASRGELELGCKDFTIMRATSHFSVVANVEIRCLEQEIRQRIRSYACGRRRCLDGVFFAESQKSVHEQSRCGSVMQQHDSPCFARKQRGYQGKREEYFACRSIDSRNEHRSRAGWFGGGRRRRSPTRTLPGLSLVPRTVLGSRLGPELGRRPLPRRPLV
jgi:hypothetical protein